MNREKIFIISCKLQAIKELYRAWTEKKFSPANVNQLKQFQHARTKKRSICKSQAAQAFSLHINREEISCKRQAIKAVSRCMNREDIYISLSLYIYIYPAATYRRLFKADSSACGLLYSLPIGKGRVCRVCGNMNRLCLHVQCTVCTLVGFVFFCTCNTHRIGTVARSAEMSPCLPGSEMTRSVKGSRWHRQRILAILYFSWGWSRNHCVRGFCKFVFILV